MQRRTVLTLSAVLAVLAIVLLQAWRLRVANELGLAGAGAGLLVAARDLPAGHQLSESDLLAVDYPKRFVPPRAIAPDLQSALVGARLAHALRAGEPMLHTDRAEERAGRKLSDRIPSTLRGLAIDVNESSTFGGLLQPGDRVDLVVTWVTPEHVTETRTLLQSVVVAAVGGAMGDEGRGRGARVRTVTVVVTAQEAEMLIFAQDQGRLSLTLHRDQDHSTADDLTRTRWLEEEAVEQLQEERRTRPQDCVTFLRADQATQTICG